MLFGEEPYWQAGYARDSVQQLSLASFADDVEETMVAADGAEGTLAEETAQFAEIIGRHGRRENREKNEAPCRDSWQGGQGEGTVDRL